MNGEDTIPVVEFYRGIGLHDHQPEARLAIVRAEIDKVFVIEDPQGLFAIAADFTWSPEARLLAAARLRAIHKLNAEGRIARAGIDLELLAAHVAGLNSVRWRDPTRYCSAFDAYGEPGAPKPPRRERPLPSAWVMMPLP
jgi:hypothetical protein